MKQIDMAISIFSALGNDSRFAAVEVVLRGSKIDFVKFDSDR